jgi:ribosomal protein S18 acetylase RimI-like enzyme
MNTYIYMHFYLYLITGIAKNLMRLLHSQFISVYNTKSVSLHCRMSNTAATHLYLNTYGYRYIYICIYFNINICIYSYMYIECLYTVYIYIYNTKSVSLHCRMSNTAATHLYLNTYGYR